MEILTAIPRKKIPFLAACALLPVMVWALACNHEPHQTAREPADYIKPIPGPSDSVPVAAAKKGEVLVGYSDCYTCHKEDKRSKGPAFRDIAKRYPVNEAYIQYLAKKIISGGSGSWGAAVMTPHPALPQDDAQTMVRYILSLRK
ncbi:c-type cytochrome [Niabella drilacis]|uniref:Cytochrome c n=1 Tax=Niabella drilacis (strain DSM 25811 / CCM 8410 / CCUG 62505 / LMG 26954 / E90) TaxID=1285928 RepID=A0A1G6MUS6_NIADE|nr:c-type cytochrome [Niabella drilacis]SDC59191.1 cytochrome c [Niabella drilacis]